MSRNVEKCREMSSFENFKKFSETCEKMSSFENFWVSENFDFMHLTARKMIFNANYEEKLTESFQNKKNWVQLGSIGRLRHFPSVCDVSRNVEKCREMSRNVEKCRVLSKSLLGGDLPQQTMWLILRSDNFSKIFFSLLKITPQMPAPLTPALINATRKNNADLGPAL